MPTTVRARLLAVVAVSTAVALAGCGSDDSTTDVAAETREVESDFGTVTLPADPQRALGMYTTDIDILIELGIPLADSQPIRGDGYTAFPSFFPQDELAGIETFQNYPEFNYEAILTAEPDLILNGLGYEPEVVERLPDIAPTYSIDAFDGADWREKFEQIATALDRVDEYKAWTASYQERVEDVRARLDAAGIDPVVAPVSYADGTVTVNCYGVPCLVFEDLGLRVSPLTEGEGTELSLEQLEQLTGIDVAFYPAIPDEDGELEGAEVVFADMQDNQLWNSLPFVRNDALVPHDLEMFFGSPSGHEAFLDVVEQALLG